MLLSNPETIQKRKKITEIVYAKHLAEASALCCGQSFSEHFLGFSEVAVSFYGRTQQGDNVQLFSPALLLGERHEGGLLCSRSC